MVKISIGAVLSFAMVSSEHNDFALLKEIGRECAGAISFCEIDEPEIIQIYDKFSSKQLSKDELEKHIKELPTKPYLGRRMSLAGAQEKTSVCLINGEIALPLDDTPTTHILKPKTVFKQSVQNEYICMKTAKAISLPVADVKIHKANNTEFLLIKRFDRLDEECKIKLAPQRRHQEDFAQASGVWAENKYDFTFKDCSKVIEQLKNPAFTKNQFIKIAVFNFLIGGYLPKTSTYQQN